MLRSYSRKGMRVLFCAAMMLSAILLFGCSSGGNGDTGATGAQGPPGPAGPPGQTTTTAESCEVCHTAGKIADIAPAHPDPTGQDVTISSIALTNTGGFAVVSFHAATAAGPVTDLTFADMRFMLADLVPAGTATIGYPPNPSWGTWPTDYFERWASETSSTVGATFDTTNAATGDYTYTFATAFGSAAAVTDAPDYDPTHTQRLAILIRGHNDANGNALTNNTVGFLDFVVPADGASAAPLDSQRQIVTADACKECHSPLFQKAHHADVYLDTRTCDICHSPIGHYGYLMQTDGAYLPVLVHQIHDAIDNYDPVADTGFDFSEVTYPQDIRNCVVCHTNSGQNLGTGDQIDNWKENPSAKTCGSCHTDISFTDPPPAGYTLHSGGAQTDYCFVCHPAEGHINVATGASVTEAHDTAPDAVLHPTPENIPEFDVTLNITPNHAPPYVAGEVLEVRVTLTDHATGIAVPSTVYTTPQQAAGLTGGGLNVASLYVYGPRAKAVPVLATGTITDPAFDSATDTPTQGLDLFIGGTDPLVITDSSGFGYRLLAIPADMQAGTYMVRVRMGDYDRVTDSNYRIESTAFQTIQIGTATVEDKVAGDDCTNCHGTGTAPFHDARHAVVFDTDQCLSCHDQSGNFAIPLANRVHAVHSANPDGDIFVLNGGSPSSRDWSDITFPQNILSPVTGHTEDDGLPRCVGCHTSGDVTYKTLPYMMPCVGCHADAVSPATGMPADIDHMRQNGGPF